MATANDASDAVKDMSFVGYPNPKVKLIAERLVDGPTVPGCSITWAYEQETSVRGRGEGFSRRLYAAAGPVVFGVRASAVGTFWSWEEIVPIAEMMVERIGGVLESETR